MMESTESFLNDFARGYFHTSNISLSLSQFPPGYNDTSTSNPIPLLVSSQPFYCTLTISHDSFHPSSSSSPEDDSSNPSSELLDHWKNFLSLWKKSLKFLHTTFRLVNKEENLSVVLHYSLSNLSNLSSISPSIVSIDENPSTFQLKICYKLTMILNNNLSNSLSQYSINSLTNFASNSLSTSNLASIAASSLLNNEEYDRKSSNDIQGNEGGFDRNESINYSTLEFFIDLYIPLSTSSLKSISTSTSTSLNPSSTSSTISKLTDLYETYNNNTNKSSSLTLNSPINFYKPLKILFNSYEIDDTSCLLHFSLLNLSSSVSLFIKNLEIQLLETILDQDKLLEIYQIIENNEKQKKILKSKNKNYFNDLMNTTIASLSSSSFSSISSSSSSTIPNSPPPTSTPTPSTLPPLPPNSTPEQLPTSSGVLNREPSSSNQQDNDNDNESNYSDNSELNTSSFSSYCGHFFSIEALLSYQNYILKPNNTINFLFRITLKDLNCFIKNWFKNLLQSEGFTENFIGFFISPLYIHWYPMIYKSIEDEKERECGEEDNEEFEDEEEENYCSKNLSVIEKDVISWSVGTNNSLTMTNSSKNHRTRSLLEFFHKLNYNSDNLQHFLSPMSSSTFKLPLTLSLHIHGPKIIKKNEDFQLKLLFYNNSDLSLFNMTLFTNDLDENLQNDDPDIDLDDDIFSPIVTPILIKQTSLYI